MCGMRHKWQGHYYLPLYVIDWEENVSETREIWQWDKEWNGREYCDFHFILGIDLTNIICRSISISSPFSLYHSISLVAYITSIVMMSSASAIQTLSTTLLPFPELMIIGRIIMALFSPLSDAALILYLQVLYLLPSSIVYLPYSRNVLPLIWEGHSLLSSLLDMQWCV